MKYQNPFLKQLAETPYDKTILLANEESILAGDLLRDSEVLASNLQRKGVERGDRIVLALPLGLDFLRIIYCAMILDLVVAIIDPEMGRDNYKSKLKQFNPQWAFVDYRLLFLQEHPILRWIYFFWKKNGLYFPYSKKIKTIATGKWLPIFQKVIKFEAMLSFEDAVFTPPVRSKKQVEEPIFSIDKAFLITYTSGTTSVPKGVVHSFHSLNNSINLIADLVGNPKGQKLVTHLPHFVLLGITSGLPVHLWDYPISPEERLQFIDNHQVTMLFGPPSEYLELMQVCKKQNRKLPESLTHIMVGSAPVRAAFLNKIIPLLPEKTRITCLYGMTENLVVTSIDGREKVDYNCKGDVLGKPFKNVKIRIAHDGEILVKSDQLFTRYFHKKDRNDWHPTGDLGYVDEHGNLILTGRKKDMIIRRNTNIYPGLYEPTINKIKGIQEAVMIGIYDENLADEQVFLAIEKEEDIDAYNVKKQLEIGDFSIDKEALPDEIVFMDLPRKGRQKKVDKKAVATAIKRALKSNRGRLVS